MAMSRSGNGPIDIMCLAQNIAVTAGELAPHAGLLNTVRRTVRLGYYKARAWLEQGWSWCAGEVMGGLTHVMMGRHGDISGSTADLAAYGEDEYSGGVAGQLAGECLAWGR